RAGHVREATGLGKAGHFRGDVQTAHAGTIQVGRGPGNGFALDDVARPSEDHPTMRINRRLPIRRPPAPPPLIYRWGAPGAPLPVCLLRSRKAALGTLPAQEPPP